MRKSLLLGLFFLIILLINCVLSAQEIILEIKAEGNYHISTEMIKSVVTFEVGDFLNPGDISESIKNLYQLGVFNNIEIEADALSSGLLIKIIIEEFPVIDKVEIKGNKKVKDSKIKEVIALKTGAYLSPFLLKETSGQIAQEYKKKSYNFADVEYEEIPSDNHTVDVVINVNEGQKIAIKEINIHGNKEMPSAKLVKKMKTRAASLLRSGKFEEDKFEEDLLKVIEYYKKKGYVDSRIISSETSVKDNKHMIIDIYLFEGIQYHFGNVSVQGNTKFNSESITGKFKFKDNEIFNMEKFNTHMNEVSSLYYEEGYIYAQFNQDLQKKGNIIDIVLSVEEGIRAKVREIVINGNRKTKEKIIRRKLAIAPGDYFRQSRIIQTQRNIYNMGYFEPDMKLDFPTINNNGDIDVRIDVVDKTSGTANAGIGYNKYDKFVGTLSLSHNNLLGNAWSSSLNWEFGGSTQNMELEFNNPYIFDSNTLFGFNIYHTKKEWSSFDYEVYTNGASVRLGVPLDFLDYSRIVGEYSFFAKKYNITDNEETASSGFLALDKLSWQYNSSFSLSFSRDSRDNVFFPSSGSQFMLFSEVAGGPLGGDFDYYKQIAQISWYTKTFWKLVLKTKWRFGYVTAFGDTKDVPPDETFTLGGTGPDGIRGYADRTIVPEDSEEGYGGNREIIFSAEYGLPLVGDDIIAMLFFDAGDCYNKLEYFNFWTMKKGGGTGIRIRSPLGIIGFDYAYNFDTDKWEPHFQFGTSF